jgi:hypothetical protein
MASAQAAMQQLAIQQQQIAAQNPELAQNTQQQQPNIANIIMQNPLMQMQITTAQVAHMLVDIVIDEAPETAVLVDEQYEKLANTIPAIVQVKPDLAPSLVKALIKASSLSNKNELLQEFEQGPDPALVQAQQQAQQLTLALQQVQLQLAQTRSQLQQAQTAKVAAETQAIPAKLQLDAQKLQIDAQKANAAIQATEIDSQQTRAKTAALVADTTINVDKAQREAMPHVTIISKQIGAPTI